MNAGSTTRIIVTRHKAAQEFIAAQLGGKLNPAGTVITVAGMWSGECSCEPHHPEYGYSCSCGLSSWGFIEEIPIFSGNVSAEDVAGKDVYGVLPLHLAAKAAAMYVVEFVGAPPRGQEYGLPAMQAAGAVLRRYKVDAV